jgi:hypothetical protein
MHAPRTLTIVKPSGSGWPRFCNVCLKIWNSGLKKGKLYQYFARIRRESSRNPITAVFLQESGPPPPPQAERADREPRTRKRTPGHQASRTTRAAAVWARPGVGGGGVGGSAGRGPAGRGLGEGGWDAPLCAGSVSKSKTKSDAKTAQRMRYDKVGCVPTAPRSRSPPRRGPKNRFLKTIKSSMTDATRETAAPTLPTTPPSVILDADATTRSCTTASIFKVTAGP